MTEIDKEKQKELDEFYRRNPDFKGVEDLHAILTKRQSIPNQLTLAELEEFEPLFRKPPNIEKGTKEEFEFSELIKTLTDKYREKVNLFKWTIIVYSAEDPTPVPEFPPFPPVFMTTAAPPMDEQSERAFSAFRRNMQSDIPANLDRGDAIAHSEFKRAQMGDDNVKRIFEVRRASIWAMDEFKRRKALLAEGKLKITEAGTVKAVANKAEESQSYNTSYADSAEMDFL